MTSQCVIFMSKWFGFIAVATFSIIWIGSAALDPTWVFAEDTISEFGISGTLAEPLFNYGCILTGAIIVLYGIGLALANNNKPYKTGGVFLVLAGIFLAAVGLVPMDLGEPHVFIAITMGIFLVCAMCSLSVQDWKEGRVFIPGLTVFILVICATLMLTQNSATFEEYSVILVFFWVCMEGFSVLLRPKNSNSVTNEASV